MANTKISELSAASSLADADSLLIVQGGTTKKITKANALGTMASQDADSVNIDGGAIDGTTIGANNSSAATFSTLTMSATSPQVTFSPGIGVTMNLAKYLILSSADIAITADTGSSQGDGPLTHPFNVITTCANAGDAVTLPSALVGAVVIVINVGAQSADVFPASGDEIGTAGLNTAVAVAAKTGKLFIAGSTTTWAVF